MPYCEHSRERVLVGCFERPGQAVDALRNQVPAAPPPPMLDPRAAQPQRDRLSARDEPMLRRGKCFDALIDHPGTLRAPWDNAFSTPPMRFGAG